MAEVIIYTSGSGGMMVQKYSTQMFNLVRGVIGKDPKVVYCDCIDAEERKKVWDISGKKGVYPLLFVGETFIGVWDDVEMMNEEGSLKEKLC